MSEQKKCEICGKPFTPSKYRPNQQICSNVECQYERQLSNMAVWRKKNPNYFKYKEANDVSWKDSCKERSSEWRKKHKEYLKLYREAHKDRHRNYMREYMRKYRQMKKEDKEKNA